MKELSIIYNETKSPFEKIICVSVNQYIIALKLDETCKTNENILDVDDKIFVKFRYNKAFVIEIFNKFTNESINSIPSDHGNSFICDKGKYITVNDYDENCPENAIYESLHNIKPRCWTDECFKWTVKIHNAVNIKLNNSIVSFNDAKKLIQNEKN